MTEKEGRKALSVGLNVNSTPQVSLPAENKSTLPNYSSVNVHLWRKTLPEADIDAAALSLTHGFILH